MNTKKLEQLYSKQSIIPDKCAQGNHEEHNAEKLSAKNIIINNLEEHKALDIIVIDIHKLTDIADFMIFASGTSSRHIKSLAKHLMDNLKENGYSILGSEGEENSDWILIDTGNIIIHLMLPETRKFYELEKLWGEL